MLGRTTFLLRKELADNPVVIGPWAISRPGFALFAENLGDEECEIQVKGGSVIGGPFVREYGSDTIITVPPKGRIVPAVITDIAKFIALHLTAANPDGVRVELVHYNVAIDPDVARESVTVT